MSITNKILNTNKILGYPLRIIVDKKGRSWPTPVLKIISYEEYRQLEPQRSTISLAKNPYNYWIPCYFNRKHFLRAQKFIDKGIMVLFTNGKKSEPFQHDAIIKVFPKIINQTLLLTEEESKVNIKKLIKCYCNFVHLFKKYLDEYPDLMKIINLQINEFITSRDGRHRNNILDLGEFIAKISFSSLANNYSFDNIRKTFVKEFISRQFYWIFKNNREMAKSFYYYKNINIEDCFSLMKGKLITLYHAIIMAEKLINPNVLQILELNYGFPSEEIINDILLKKSSNNINNLKELLECITLTKFQNENQIKKYLHNCCAESFMQNYTTFDPHYRKNQSRVPKSYSSKSFCFKQAKIADTQLRLKTVAMDGCLTDSNFKERSNSLRDESIRTKLENEKKIPTHNPFDILRNTKSYN